MQKNGDSPPAPAGAWWPVLLCMALIFWGSTDALAAHRTSRFLGPLLRWLIPDISDAGVRLAQAFVRKTGHVTEFALLAMLTWRALRRSETAIGDSGAESAVGPQVWSWRTAGWALGVAALYAVSDEIHQAFVPTRQASALDVLIDAAGAAAGLAILRGWHRWKFRAL